MARVTIRSPSLTLERVVFRQARAFVPGLVEKTLAANPGLAALGPTLPVGTGIDIPDATAADRAASIAPVRLTD